LIKYRRPNRQSPTWMGALASSRNLMGFLDAFKAIFAVPSRLHRATWFSVMPGLVPGIPAMTTFGPVIDALRRFRLIILNWSRPWSWLWSGPPAPPSIRQHFHEQSLPRRQIGTRRHSQGRHGDHVGRLRPLRHRRDLVGRDPRLRGQEPDRHLQ